jgi:NitT/TauT family transport system substrate-binding protein
MKRGRGFSGLIALVLLAGACQAEEQPPDQPGRPAPESATLLIDFFPNGNQAFFYGGIGEGYFEDEGLELNVEHVLGGTEVLRAVEAGRAQFGYADLASMAIAVENEGADLIAVMGLLQQIPMALMSPAANNIEEPADLEGKRVADFAGSVTQVVWPVFLDVNGLSEADVDVELIDPAARLAVVVQGRADAAAGFFTNNGPELSELCDCQVNIMRWKDFGVQALGNGIVVNTAYMEENPDVVESFVRAMARSLEFAQANPEGSVDHLLELKGGDIALSRDVTLTQALNTLTLFTSPNGGGDPPGYMTEEDWRATVDLMVEAGQMPEPEDIQALYTNEFVPGAP